MKKILLIINGPACGTDEPSNAVRLAVALGKRDDAEVKIFLMGDGATCAVAGRKTPGGYYTLDRMLRSFAHHGGRIGCCGTCRDARGLTEDHLIEEAPRSSMDELATWTLDADQGLTF
ncbi:DsrE/DsrF/TusD sulfur relay family protein [Kocuria turfanensis]|uniref:DsrE/DsrF/TusD sulfur relay family protein n=1 Tax=Kocuria turfanensis TaxID=388357 RepID=UPI004037012F